MAAYIDLDYVEAFIDPSLVQRLFTDDAQVGFVQENFDIVANAATTKVRSRLSEAGYTPPDDLTTLPEAGRDLIRSATVEVFKKLAFARKILPVEAETPNYKSIADQIQSGEADVEGLSANTATAVGGISFTESSATVAAGNYSQIFPRNMNR